MVIKLTHQNGERRTLFVALITAKIINNPNWILSIRADFRDVQRHAADFQRGVGAV